MTSSCLIFCILVAVVAGIASSVGLYETSSYIQNELGSMSSAHSSITSFLHGKAIPVSKEPLSLRKARSSSNTKKLIVTLSQEDSPIECRVTLQRAPVGSKCIAPCGCTGSQQWITFSEFNRLRRIEPSQWISCQTCQQKFDYSLIRKYGGVAGNAVTTVLDNTIILRGIIALFAASSLSLGVGSLLQKLFLSRALWQLYPKWSKIVHLPLVLKFWGGKLVAQFLGEKYLLIEKEVLKYLAEIETSAVEPNLPITV